MKRCFFLALVVCVPFLGADKQVCPWMNAATAAGILDGAVEMTVAGAPACEFVRQKPPAYALRIEVSTGVVAADKCGSRPTVLKAIGNEAMACADEGKDGQRIERVVGRVRDQHFIIRISTGDRSITEESLIEKARRAAEQVTGNLY